MAKVPGVPLKARDRRRKPRHANETSGVEYDKKQDPSYKMGCIIHKKLDPKHNETVERQETGPFI